jgi:Cathepsin propeptide inhibitor domain (I29)
MRFEIFKEALTFIAEHNAKHARGESSFTVGLNHMTDWTKEEKDRLRMRI